MFLSRLISKSEFRLQRKWVMCVKSVTWGSLKGRKGVTASSTAQWMLMQGKIYIYIIEAQNWCSVTKISPNSKKYYIIFCHHSIVNALVLKLARLKSKFKPWGNSRSIDFILQRSVWTTQASVTSINKTSKLLFLILLISRNWLPCV